MKALHVIPSISLVHGGPSQVIRTMTAGLADLGIEIHVATTDDDGPAGRLDVPLGEPVSQDGVTYWYFDRSTLFYKASWPMTRWLKEHVADYDLLHLHALFSYTPAAAAYWARRKRIPYIVRPLGVLNRWGVTQGKPLMKQLSIALIERRVVEGSALMHYTSVAEREEAEASGLTAKSAIVPNPVEIPDEPLHRRSFPGLEGRPVVLFLSRISQKKGLDLLLKAFAQVRAARPDAALVIAGSGEAGFVEELKSLAQSLGVSEAVTWAGFLAGDAKWPAFAAADLFVLPSYSENFGVAPVEAMAAGVPVVVTDQVGVHPEVTAAKAGLVVPCEVEPLANAILNILSDPAAAQEMRTHGREYAKDNYSVQAVSHTIYRMYQSVLQNDRAPVTGLQ